ncbi:hypothetical protein POSPLADRAFT_1122355, partial [Postia placenta MAD-698-R-SB12]
LDRAYLAAIWLETLFYGVNTILFFWCLTILTIRCHTVKINKILVTVALLMVVLSTSHVSLGFYRLLKGFILLRDQPGGPAAYFSDISRPENVAKITIQGLGAVVGDSVVVWRCWLVWNRSWKICFVPIILVIGTAGNNVYVLTPSLVCGLGQAVAFAHAQRYHDVFVLPIQIWSGALFAFSISSNVLVTGLIALRAWHLLQLSQGLTTFRTWKILLIIVESGMIYSISVTLMLSLYYLGSNSFYIIYDPIDQLGTMIPMAIIILAALGFTTNNIES